MELNYCSFFETVISTFYPSQTISFPGNNISSVVSTVDTAKLKKICNRLLKTFILTFISVSVIYFNRIYFVFIITFIFSYRRINVYNRNRIIGRKADFRISIL